MSLVAPIVGTYLVSFPLMSWRIIHAFLIFIVCSVDSTKDNGRKGRLLNHSKKHPNVVTKVMELDGHPCPYLCLVARRDIEIGEELVYDYGERRAEVVDLMPWLAS